MQSPRPLPAPARGTTSQPATQGNRRRPHPVEIRLAIWLISSIATPKSATNNPREPVTPSTDLRWPTCVGMGGRDHRNKQGRPSTEYLFRSSSASPPRTRGSAIAGTSSPGRTSVSPAHAGIGLNSTNRGRRVTRLPRARGDRPTLCYWCFGFQQSPPRSRGSASTMGFKGWSSP